MTKRMSISRTKAWWAFSALCALGGIQWLLPNAGSGQPVDALASLVGAVCAAILAWGYFWQKEKPSAPQATLLRTAGGGALVYAGLHWSFWVKAPGLRSGDVAIALAITAVVIVVAEQALGQSIQGDLTTRLWPGLAGVAGMLLVLPQPSLTNLSTAVALVGAPLLTGVGAALVSQPSGKANHVCAAALTGAVAGAAFNALLLGIAWPSAATASMKVLLWRAAWEGASLLLSFVALTRLGAFHWSAVFVVVPLLLVLEAAVLGLSWPGGRSLMGAALLLIASAFLLFSQDENESARSLF